MWASEHGLHCTGSFELQLPELELVWDDAYANGRRSGREAAVAGELLQRLGEWDECLVVVTQWGVWPSGEDWPRYYAWRGAQGERRELWKAPGHRFAPTERGLIQELLTLIMENGWDADVLCSVGGRADRRLAKVSHDEWCEVRAAP